MNVFKLCCNLKLNLNTVKIAYFSFFFFFYHITSNTAKINHSFKWVCIRSSTLYTYNIFWRKSDFMHCIVTLIRSFKKYSERRRIKCKRILPYISVRNENFYNSACKILKSKIIFAYSNNEYKFEGVMWIFTRKRASTHDWQIIWIHIIFYTVGKC